MVEPRRDAPQGSAATAVKAFLARHAAPLRLARQAAHREYCDWQLPPLTLQNIQDSVSLLGIQDLRTIAFLLSVECRYQIAEQRFDDAIETLQTGLALARHVGQGNTLIQGLVAIALAQVMFSCVLEWIQVPGSPNLYWPLTALPQPFLDVRRPMIHEMNTIYRSFPQLRELQKETLSIDEVNLLMGKLSRAPPRIRRLPRTQRLDGDAKNRHRGLYGEGLSGGPQAAVGPGASGEGGGRDADGAGRPDVLSQRRRPYARRPAQVVNAAIVAGSAGAGGDGERREIAARKGGNNPIFYQLMPALGKIFAAKVRLEMDIASLRCAEALRFTPPHTKANRRPSGATLPLCRGRWTLIPARASIPTIRSAMAAPS